MIRRFRGAMLALVVLVAVLGVAAALELRTADAPDDALPDPIFRFEKEDLVGFEVVRPDATIAVRKVDGVWKVDGQPWRPNKAMIRRVGHQLHDLDARADVVEAPETADLARYGLGPDAIRVTLTLADGRQLAFAVGDPNPTSVSYYMRPLDSGTADPAGPGGPVYVVKKAAMDYYRLDVEAFREDRIATFDADDAVRLEAVVDGRRIDVEKVGERVYRMHAPVEQAAARDEVRMMLGRISALRAVRFVEDAPADLGRYSLDPPLHRVVVTLASGETLSVRVGDAVPGTDPPERYVYLEEDDAVYTVRDGLLDSYRRTADEMRDRELLGTKHEWNVTAMTVTQGGESLALTRTSDDWRWPDGQAVPGSTPKRVAARAAELRALTFFDDGPPADPGLDIPWATIELTFDDGTAGTVRLGDGWEVEVTAPPPPSSGRRPGPPPEPVTRTEARRYARVGDGPVVEVDGQLAQVVQDLFREYGRKVERDGDKRLDAVPVPQ